MSTKKVPQSLGAQGVEKWNNVGVNQMESFSGKSPRFWKNRGLFASF
jgi:hypothetical protein